MPKHISDSNLEEFVVDYLNVELSKKEDLTLEDVLALTFKSVLAKLQTEGFDVDNKRLSKMFDELEKDGKIIRKSRNLYIYVTKKTRGKCLK